MRYKGMLFTFAIAGLIVVLAPACNTLRGAGKDIQRAGEKIQKWTH